VIDDGNQIWRAPVVEIRRVLQKPSQWNRPVLAGCRPRGIRRIHSDFGWIVQEWDGPIRTAQHVREIRRLMARAAPGLAPEQILSTLSGLAIEIAARRPMSRMVGSLLFSVMRVAKD